ncbi:hypothetical protein [Sorangium sp. So ce233]|uniref:hypothetical protein n=1 Tax=Sorangium sp. So ce233 TaxID=3133290 RepID=UPI003F637BA4
MAWCPVLAREYLDQLIEDAETCEANDLSEEARRLRQATEEDLSHPAVMRAFVRGACGYDLARDCTMIFFYAICLGDRALFRDLLEKHRRMERSGFSDVPTKAWHRAQDAFWTRADIDELRALAESRPAAA